MKHLYLHIPFCHRRCSYCDFNTYANMEDRIEAYVAALCQEIALRAPAANHTSIVNQPALPFDKRLLSSPKGRNRLPKGQSSIVNGLTRNDLRPTIFFGGGTPSMLSASQVERILAAADTIVPVAQAEVTLEANPGTVLGQGYLRDLRSLGVNRLSMGVQTLDDPTLRVLGRIHTAAEAHASFADAQRAGFERINLDFIFGLPGQTLATWRATLDEIVTWGAEHFSLYSLILEEGTPLHAQVLGGRVHIPDDDAAGEMYELALERLAAAGYVQYEISNWAKLQGSGVRGQGSGVKGQGTKLHTLNPDPRPLIPIGACHHNLAYWLNTDYLACGAGAHGHTYPQRYADVLGIDEYIRRVQSGVLPTAETTALSSADLYAETMFMGLRLNVGVSYAHFRERCGAELGEVYGPTLHELVQLGLIEQDAVGVRLSARGRMLGNQVFARFT